MVSKHEAREATRIPPPELSIITPVFNEQGNLLELEKRLFEVVDSMGDSVEIIAVNDGSTDGSAEILSQIAARRPNFRVVNFRRNYGQTAAMMAAIDLSRGDVIVSLDSDLQSDPRDIPRLLEKLNEGYDVVSGWRKNRKDNRLVRNFPSWIANRLISAVSGVALHDYGCTLKAYRREVLQGFRLYGEMHRFIPIYASWMGATLTEMPVQHHARSHGESKYGLGRMPKVLLDLIVVMFFSRYFVKPIYVFGGFGLLSFAGSALTGTYATYLKLFKGVSFILTPLPLMCMFLLMIGFVSVLMGLLAEMLSRTYYESQGSPAYTIRSVLNEPE